MKEKTNIGGTLKKYKLLKKVANEIIDFNKKNEGFRSKVSYTHRESEKSTNVINGLFKVADYFEKAENFAMAEKAYNVAKSLGYSARVRAFDYDSVSELDLLGDKAENEIDRLHNYRLGRAHGYLKHKGLEKKVGAATSVVGFIGAIFFLSANLTGFAVSNLNQTSSNWIGAGLFVVGLLGAFLYFKQR